MRARLLGRILVAWHGARSPSADEWSAFLALIRTAEPTPTLGLVLTQGGAPSPTQQIELAQAIGARTVRVAVVSDHVGVRFVVSSLALVMKRIRSFPSSALDEAYVHLGLEPEEARQSDELIAQWRSHP